MQPNTSFWCDCRSLLLAGAWCAKQISHYFNLLVNGCQEGAEGGDSRPARPGHASISCGRSSGRKSILRALASFAAVRNEKLTSWCSTFVMYGRDTFIRRARSVWVIPSSLIRRSIRRRNADPILSTASIFVKTKDSSSPDPSSPAVPLQPSASMPPHRTQAPQASLQGHARFRAKESTHPRARYA